MHFVLILYKFRKFLTRASIFYLDYLVELNQFHPVFTQWSSTEPELSKTLQAIASAIDANASAHQKVLDSTVNDEREYVAYIDAVKDALNRRDTIQMDFELTAEDLNKRRAEREQVSDCLYT